MQRATEFLDSLALFAWSYLVIFGYLFGGMSFSDILQKVHLPIDFDLSYAIIQRWKNINLPFRKYVCFGRKHSEGSIQRRYYLWKKFWEF